MTKSVLFTPFKIGPINCANRAFLAPMTRVSGTQDGHVGPLMQPYYETFAKGGFAAIISEGVYTDKAFSQGYKFQPGIADQQQAESWKSLISAVQGYDCNFILQLMHAGALSQYNRFVTGTRGPSAVQPLGAQLEFYRGSGAYPLPKEMSVREIEFAIQGFVDCARRAEDAGVDGVEIHGANGYLLDQFLTSYTNNRSDGYGGDCLGRIKLTCEIIERVAEALDERTAVGVRISQSKVNDADHHWEEADSAAQIVFKQLAAAGARYIHTTELAATRPAFSSGLATLSELAREYSGLPVIANGGLGDPQAAEEILNDGKADLISLGKPALATPDWPHRVRTGLPLNKFNFDMFSPIADLESQNTNKAKGAD